MKRLGGWFHPEASMHVTWATTKAQTFLKGGGLHPQWCLLRDQIPKPPVSNPEGTASFMINCQEFQSDIASLHIAPQETGPEALIKTPKRFLQSELVDTMVEPKSFNEVWNHRDPCQCGKWQEAIGKEFSDMKTRKVWKRI
jgi:hypothetical protein